MKRTLAIILALLLVFGLFTGCDSKEPEVPAAAPTPTPTSKPETAAEVGYWTLSRVESDDPERVMSEEDIETLRSIGLEIFIDLKEGGNGGIMMDEYAELKWADGKFDLGNVEFNMSYAIKGEELWMDFEGDSYVFVRGEGEAPKAELSTAPEEPAEENPLDWWSGDWYGWRVVDSGYGDYADWDGYYWDCYATINVHDDETGYINLWDQDGSSYDNLMGCEVYFGAGASEMGTMWAESGYFMDADIEHADWNADPGAMGFELDDMIYIEYRYVDPYDSDNRMDLEIFLRPWGRDWEDLATGGDPHWPHADMMPLYYNEWYLPLIEMGSPLPASFAEGFEIIESNIFYGTGEVLASGEWSDCIIEVVGAESFVDSDGKDAIRVYYDFTNLSDEDCYALSVLSINATQDEYEQVYAYASYEDDVAEYGNDYLDVRSGVTIRCVAEYSMKLSGGTYIMEFYDFWDEENSFTVEFDPQNLPGRPPKWQSEQIINPMWLANVTTEGELDECYVSFDHVEIFEDYNGDYAIRFYVLYTNLSDEACTFNWDVMYTAFQDGIELASTWPDYGYERPEDDMVYEEVAPGESTMVSLCFELRNEQSPIEFQMYDGWTDAVVGIVCELTWGG